MGGNGIFVAKTEKSWEIDLGERRQDELLQDMKLKATFPYVSGEGRAERTASPQPFLTLTLCASAKMAMCQTAEKCNHYF